MKQNEWNPEAAMERESQESALKAAPLVESRKVSGVKGLDLAHMLSSSPPPQDWIIDGLIPCDIIGVLNAQGGSGKTFWLLDLAISVALGVPFLGNRNFAAGEPKKVVVVLGEETADTVHIRLRKILSSKGIKEDKQALLLENLSIFSGHGVPGGCGVFAEQNGNKNAAPVESEFYNSIKSFINSFDPMLVLFDPLSRFYQSDENDNSKATRFIEYLEGLKHSFDSQGPKRTVIVAHHNNKGGNNGQGSARGASAFIDGARWQCTLQRHELEPQYVEMRVPKFNYGKFGSGNTWLEVDGTDKLGGVLFHALDYVDQFEGLNDKTTSALKQASIEALQIVIDKKREAINKKREGESNATHSRKNAGKTPLM